MRASDIFRRHGRQEGEVSSLVGNSLKAGIHSISLTSGAKRIVLGLGLSVFFVPFIISCGVLNEIIPESTPTAQSIPANKSTPASQSVPNSQSAPAGMNVAASQSGGSWNNAKKVLSPQHPGHEVLGKDVKEIDIDISNRSEGYIVAHYTGGNDKVKLILRKTGERSGDYVYDLVRGGYDVIPLSGGSGTYELSINENITGDRYAIIFTDSFNANVANEFRMYLYPNQYVSFGASSQAVRLAEQLTANATDVFKAVENIYNHIVANIAYDTDKAKRASLGQMTGYLPDVDQTLARGKGICFDYAATAAAMLRSQGISTRLVIGYSGSAYHAWIDVHVDGKGFVNAIRFNGESWVLMDPTYAAAYAAAGVSAYVGDGTNYNPIYYY